MMRPFDSLPETFREALAIHDIMNTHGVPADHIFVALVEGKLVVVAKDKDKSFGVNAGPTTLNQDDFTEMWNAAVRTYNKSRKVDRAWLLDHSRARVCAVEIIAGLVMQGFMPRSLVQEAS